MDSFNVAKDFNKNQMGLGSIIAKLAGFDVNI